ncbi:hypothetical protein T265_15721 [Opisthorchis viverrini]|uniref:BPTI/Kunitz inhibitor domain-containing protein n=1 Tax=Opisthorchis viverrini TaxID=6198 RepID=A0A074ZUU1_OPIVI|nr:hypothetical protein T265_15721 [Opisthorchis viverrini]KER18974.1 hypothetical protein T265_15721 [Opisthorchis viverrini]
MQYKLFLLLIVAPLLCNTFPTQPKDICLHQKDTGFCHVNSITKYYYDNRQKKCLTYKDRCGTSKNRFDSYDQCYKQCSHLMNTH